MLQNAALLRDFTGPQHCLVAMNLETLDWKKRLNGWTVEYLPKCRPTSAFVLRKPKVDTPECWVRWDYQAHRRVFQKFLQVYYAEFETVLNDGTHVDHIEPKTRFISHLSKGDQYFIRLHLVQKSINTGSGAGYERNFYQTERMQPLPNALHMSWISYCKVCGIRLPRKTTDKSEWESWARTQAAEFSASTGESEAHAYVGFISVLQLGYTGYYAGEAGGIDLNDLTQQFKTRKESSNVSRPASDCSAVSEIWLPPIPAI